MALRGLRRPEQSAAGPPTGRTRGPARTVLRRALLALLALWLVTPALHAEERKAPVDISPGIATLRPGTEVTLSWGPLPAGTEEFELLLVSDSPASLTLRLTESMDPALQAFRWQVPNVPCTRARILVRTGDGDDEREWAESRPFGIAWDGETPVAVVRERGGEFWLSEETSRVPPSSLSEGGPSVDRTLPGRREEARGTAPTDDPLRPRAAAGLDHALPAALPACLAAGAPHRCPSLFVPLRI